MRKTREPYALKYFGGMSEPDAKGMRRKVEVDSTPHCHGRTLGARLPKGIKRQLRHVRRQNPPEFQRQLALAGAREGDVNRGSSRKR